MNTPAARAGGAALLVVLAMAAGAWVYSSQNARHRLPGVPVPVGEASAPNAVDAESSGLPGVLPAGKIPDRLPAFALEDRTGKLTSIAEFAGKSLVINFWATWCTPCQREIPLLLSLDAGWGKRNVAVIGVAVDYRDKVLKFADRFKITYPLLIGEQDALDVAAELGVDSPVFPFTVFTDRRGEVVALYVGELHQPQADLILSVVQKLDTDLLQLPAARRVIADGLSAVGAAG